MHRKRDSFDHPTGYHGLKATDAAGNIGLPAVKAENLLMRKVKRLAAGAICQL